MHSGRLGVGVAERLHSCILVRGENGRGPGTCIPAQQPGPSPAIPVTAADVAVDFVIRARKGRVVRDLRPADIEVL